MIINSLIDNDLYKFTMMQAVFHQGIDTPVEYEFKCRSGEDLRPYAEEIQEEINFLGNLRFSNNELDYLETLPYMKKDFIEYLRYFQLFQSDVEVSIKSNLEISVKGNWLHTILYEVPILSIVNEVYCRNTVPDPDYFEAHDRLYSKINYSRFKFAEFGTRRRFSKSWQDSVVKTIKKYTGGLFLGTSNVYLAKKYDLNPIGTMAHEWIMAGQGLYPIKDSQKIMLQKWQDEYRGNLGIALTDTITTDVFLKDFDKYFAKLYDGVRQDSGDPRDFAWKMLRHYRALGIEPKTKTIVFSDGLDFKKANLLYNMFGEDINVMFGIGTNLTNDFPDVKPLSIVMKMQQCNGKPVAKISDVPAKAQCQYAEYLKELKKTFGLGE